MSLEILRCFFEYQVNKVSSTTKLRRNIYTIRHCHGYSLNNLSSGNLQIVYN